MKFTEFLIESLDKRHYARQAFFGTNRNQTIVSDLHNIVADHLEDHTKKLGLEQSPFDIQIKHESFEMNEFADDLSEEDDYLEWIDDDADLETMRDQHRNVHTLATKHEMLRHNTLVQKLFKQITQHGERFIVNEYGSKSTPYEFQSSGEGKDNEKHELVAYMVSLSQVPHHEKDADVALPPTLIKEIVHDVEKELRTAVKGHVKDIRVAVVEGSGTRASHVTFHDRKVHEHPYKYYTMLITFEWYHGPIHPPTGKGEVSIPNEKESFALAAQHLLALTTKPLNEFLPELASFIEEQSA